MDLPNGLALGCCYQPSPEVLLEYYRVASNCYNSLGFLVLRRDKNEISFIDIFPNNVNKILSIVSYKIYLYCPIPVAIII